MSKKISIIVPCYNEEKNVNRTIDGLLEVLKDRPYELEILVVDDGSKDSSWKVIKEYSARAPQVKGIRHMCNYGQAAAYQTGFDAAQGDYVITVSADLETPLENVLTVIQKLEEGYDLVNTHRVGRWEEGNENNKASGASGRAKKSKLANRIIASISKVNVADRGSGMKGFSKVIAKNLRLYGDMHRFIPDYAAVYGAKMTEFEVPFKDRDFGVSAYKGTKRTIKVLLDLPVLAFMLYFAKKPFHAMPGRIFGLLGALSGGLGILSFLYLIIAGIFWGQNIIANPLFSGALLMLILGVLSLFVGMLGELLLRVYFESSGRRTYTIREITE